MKWVHQFLFRFSVYRRLVHWSKRVVLPGFAPLPLYEVMVFFANEIQEQTILNRAASLSFNFMLAFFPATIFLFTLIPYIPLKDFQGKLLTLLSTVLPHNAYLAFQQTIVDLVKVHNGKLLSFGFLAALYFSTTGISKLMQAFNRSSLTTEKRTWLKRRLIAVALTVMISFGLLIAIIVMTVSEAVITYLQSHFDARAQFWFYVLAFSRWIVLIAIFLISISLLYRYGPANKEKWKFFSTGSFIATLLAVLTSMGFNYYINHFSTYNKIYGSLGALIVLMLWLYLNSLILLIGFELNASIDFSKRNIKIERPRFNHFRQ